MSDWVINIASEQFPAGKYMSKVNNKNRTKREIYLTLTINDAIGATGVLVSLLLTLNIFHNLFYCFYC